MRERCPCPTCLGCCCAQVPALAAEAASCVNRERGVCAHIFDDHGAALYVKLSGAPRHMPRAPGEPARLGEDPQRGVLIAIEGIDAAGKATQAARLAAALGARWDRPYRVVEVPRYDSDSGRAIRAWLREEWGAYSPNPHASLHHVYGDTGSGEVTPTDELAFQALMTYNRYQIADEVRAAVADGEVVVLDRWWASSYAYGSAGGLDAEGLLRASSSLPQPDVWLLLDLRVVEAAARRKARDRHEGDLNKLARARAAYLALADRLDMVVVDAGLAIDAVHEYALAATLRALAAAPSPRRPAR